MVIIRIRCVMHTGPILVTIGLPLDAEWHVWQKPQKISTEYSKNTQRGWHSTTNKSLYNSFIALSYSHVCSICYLSPLPRLHHQAPSLLPQYYCQCCPHPHNYRCITMVVPSSPYQFSSLVFNSIINISTDTC